MTDQIRVQEFGSEIEDILSGEISIEQFYSAQVQKLIATSPRQKIELLDEKEIISFVNLANPFGNEETIQSDDILTLTKRALLTAYSKFLTGVEFDEMHSMLKGLSVYVNQVGLKPLIPVATFEINRAHALGYYKEFQYANAIKYLNPAISNCPKHREVFVGGLSDTLILLAVCYSALGRRDDALHSARLAVNISHERLEHYNKESHFSATSEDLPIFEGPVLSCFHSVILSYCTLAAELEKSGMGHLSIDWYQRAYQAASKFFLESSILQELKKLIDLSTSNYNNNNNGGNSSHLNVNTTSGRESVNREGSAPAAVILVKDPPPSSNLNNHNVEVDKISSRARPRSALPRLLKENNNNNSNNPKEEVLSSGGGPEELNHLNSISHKPFQSSSSFDGNVPVLTDHDNPRPKSAISKLGGSYQYQQSYQGPTNHLPYQVPSSSSASRGMPYSSHPYTDSQTQHAPPFPSAIQTSFPTSTFSGRVGISQQQDKFLPSPMMESTQPLGYQTLQSLPLQNESESEIPGPGRTQRLFSSQSAPLINPSIHSIVLLPSSSVGKLPEGDLSPGTPGLRKTASAKRLIEPRKTHATELMLKRKQEKQIQEQQQQQRPLSSRPGSSTLPSSRRSDDKDKEPQRTTHGEGSPTRKDRREEDQQQQQQPETSSPKRERGVSATRRNQGNSHNKTNKTVLSKVMAETKQVHPPPPHHHSQHPPHSSSSGAVAAATAVNPLLEIDEFGREKLRKIADLCFPYFKGLRIEAKYQLQRIGDRGRWYPGRIVKADFLQGLYDVEFENGDREKNISVENIRIPEYASKLMLLQATTKSLLSTTKSKKQALEESGATEAHHGEGQKEQTQDTPQKKHSSEIPARVLRKQYEEEMHSMTLKLLAGINQRSDQRKIERITLKNQLARRIQALIRGVMLRRRFPKIRQQLLKEKQLRQKERELQQIQANLLSRRRRRKKKTQENAEGGEEEMDKEEEEEIERGPGVSIEVQTGHSLIEFHPPHSHPHRHTHHSPGQHPMLLTGFEGEEEEDDPIMFIDPSSPYPHHHRSGSPAPPDLPYPHRIQLPMTATTTTTAQSYLETPVETPHRSQRRRPYDLDETVELETNREPSVKSGRFVNDHLGGETSLPMLKDTSGSEILLLPQQQQQYYLQQRLQEIDKINASLAYIQEEQQSMKELDILRNQELLQQFHGLQNLLIQQIEDVHAWKLAQEQQRQRLGELERIASPTTTKTKFFSELEPSEDREEEEGGKHYHSAHNNHTNNNSNNHPNADSTSQTHPHPRLGPKHHALSGVSTLDSLELSREDHHHQPYNTHSNNNNNNNNSNSVTFAEPEQSSHQNRPLQQQQQYELSVENSLVKSEDLRLLEEFGQLGVEDFWNSISTTEAPPLPLPQTPPAKVGNRANMLSEPSDNSNAINQVSVDYVQEMIDLVTSSASQKKKKKEEEEPEVAITNSMNSIISTTLTAAIATTTTSPSHHNNVTNNAKKKPAVAPGLSLATPEREKGGGGVTAEISIDYSEIDKALQTPPPNTTSTTTNRNNNNSKKRAESSPSRKKEKNRDRDSHSPLRSPSGSVAAVSEGSSCLCIL